MKKEGEFLAPSHIKGILIQTASSGDRLGSFETLSPWGEPVSSALAVVNGNPPAAISKTCIT